MLTEKHWRWFLVAVFSLTFLIADLGASFLAPGGRAAHTLTYRFWACFIDLIESHHDLALAAGTIAIAAFTATLWRSTNKLWKVTKQAADAATLSANAAIKIELPVVRAYDPELLDLDGPLPEQGPWAAGPVTEAAPDTNSAISHVPLRNDGRTPAFCVAFGIGHHTGQSLPSSPAYAKHRRFHPHEVIRPDQKFEIDVRYPITLSTDAISAITKKASGLWLFCQFSYTDFMDEPHEVRFCWRWGRPDHVGAFYFFADNSAPTEYTRKS